MAIEPMPDFEGDPVHGAAIKLTGAGPADRPLHVGETVLLTVEAEVTKVNHIARKGALVSEHTLDVVAVTEPLDDIVDRLRGELRDAANRREGRTPLPFDDDQDDGAGEQVPHLDHRRPPPDGCPSCGSLAEPRHWNDEGYGWSDVNYRCACSTQWTCAWWASP